MFLRVHIFYDAQSTAGLLGAIASGIISVTTLTITLLLIVVQQSASAMTTQVFDQFLRRRPNQFCFGFFIGLALYSLIILATVNEPFNPVFGGSFAFLLTVAALYLLIVLLYTTINQMRPVEIVEAIHNHLLEARDVQRETIRRTRRRSAFDGKHIHAVQSTIHGYVTFIDIESIGAALQKISSKAEVEQRFPSVLSLLFKTPSLKLKSQTAARFPICAKRLLMPCGSKPSEINNDPAYGIQQLEMIAWTSMSTAQSNPGRLAGYQRAARHHCASVRR